MICQKSFIFADLLLVLI